MHDETAGLIALFGSAVGCAMGLLVLVLIAAVWWKLVGKTGNNPLLALLFLVPLANIGLMVYLAFSEWPIERRVRELESEVARNRTS